MSPPDPSATRPAAGRHAEARSALAPCGPVVGRREGSAVVFRGVPYARADRFGPPEPLPPWTEPFDAGRPGAQSPQRAGALERLLGGTEIPTAERCHHLDVYTPGADDTGRPVLVWIHGGAFVNGGGSMPWYHGGALATRGDVVVVSINYRLGAFGFTGTTNCGLADQVAALGWVRRNIAAFGGDPDRVTVFGESAGGASVVALLAVPTARELFTGAWAMSPSLTQLRSPDRAEEARRQLLAAAGVESLDELAGLPVDAVLDAQAAVLADPERAITAFAPTVDGCLVPDAILPAAAADPRPLAMGTMRDEMLLFNAFDPRVASLDGVGLRRAFERRFGARTDEALIAYHEHRPDSPPGVVLSAMQTDEAFRVPVRALADARAAHACPTWVWWFTWATPAFEGRLGACHGLDIPFAFANLDRTGVEMFTGSSDSRDALVDEFSGSLVRFARTGDPGWAPHDEVHRPTRRFDTTCSTEHDPEPGLRRLWDRERQTCTS